jgi:hypothetical protein
VAREPLRAQGTDCAVVPHAGGRTQARRQEHAHGPRSHVYEGAHDKATLQKAGKFTAARDGNEIVLSLTNVAAGHNFPTEERHRAVDIMYRFVTKDGPAATWTRAHRVPQPYRDEAEPIGPGNASGENTQLPAGATKTVRVPIPGRRDRGRSAAVVPADAVLRRRRAR